MRYKKRKILIAALLLCLVAWYFFVPEKAIQGHYQLHSVNKGGQDVTEQLREADLERIEGLVESARCTRWENDCGPFPVREDTVVLFGEDDQGLCIVTMAGSAEKFDIRQHKLKDGEELWRAVLEILP